MERSISVQALKTISTEASLSAKILQAAHDGLATIDTTKLTDPEKKAIADARRDLAAEISTLNKIDSTATGRAESLDRTLKTASEALGVIEGIVQKATERELIIKQMLDKVAGDKGDASK